MENQQIRRQALLDALQTRVLVLDGAMGTMLQARNLTAADFGGPALEGCNENLVLTRPDVIRDIHRAYFDGGRRYRRDRTASAARRHRARRVRARRTCRTRSSWTAAKLAREAAAEYSQPGRPRFVAGSMGPTTKAITVTGGVTFPGAARQLLRRRRRLIEGGADILLLETCQDTRNVKAGLLAIERLGHELGYAPSR